MADTYEKLLEAAVDVAAPPSRVWEVMGDPLKIAAVSPQVVRTWVLGGEAAKGSRFINLNHQGRKYWPTTARIVRYVPEQEFAFRVAENKVVWSFTLEPTDTGTRLIERRETPDGISGLSMQLTRLVLGGQESFTGELRSGMHRTLDALKARAEA